MAWTFLNLVFVVWYRFIYERLEESEEGSRQGRVFNFLFFLKNLNWSCIFLWPVMTVFCCVDTNFPEYCPWASSSTRGRDTFYTFILLRSWCTQLFLLTLLFTTHEKAFFEHPMLEWVESGNPKLLQLPCEISRYNVKTPWILNENVKSFF